MAVKDTVITASEKRREILLAAGCFIAAFLVNVYAIIRFGTPWTEMFTQIGYVIVLSVIIYAVVWVIRLCIMAVMALIRRGR